MTLGPGKSRERLLGLVWRRLGKLRLLALLVVAGVVAAACAEGTYPLDIFYEMHYQQSFHSHEPPRLTAPGDAVPITGRALLTTENPIAGEMVAEGAQLFARNCVFCHGELGQGDGPVLQTMKDVYGYGTDARPYTITPILTDDFVTNQSDVAIFGWITNGVTVMPPFNKLLSVEERWLLVNYIRSLSDQ